MALPFDFADPQDPQRGDWLHFQFSNPGDAQHVGAAGFDAATLGSARTSPHLVFAAAIPPEALPAPVVRFRADALQAVTPLGMLAPDLGSPALDSRLLTVFAVAYASPANYRLHFEFTPDHGSPQRTVHAHSFDSQSFGAQLVDYSPFLRPAGLDATRWGSNTITNKSDLQQSAAPFGFVASAYTLPTVSRALRFKFSNPSYAVPPGTDVVFDFVLQGGTQGVYAGVGAATLYGQAHVANSFEVVDPQGFLSQAIGGPEVRHHTRTYLYPSGYVAGLFGTARIWNLRQYLRPSGYVTSLHGGALASGGVKTVTPGGIASLAFGPVTVINTTADQAARPAGIAWPGMGSASVSPRMLRPAGILGTAMGSAKAQFPPRPVGWLSGAFGYPTIEYRTKILRPAGVDSYGEGFPRVADRARKLLHTASNVTAVFGDTLLRNKNFKVTAQGFDALSISPWAELRSTRRFLRLSAIPPLGVGVATEARNKTPSIKPTGIAALAFGDSAYTTVGWRVRALRPSGVPAPFAPFGLASLWQTPGLAPVGIAAPAVPNPSIWPAIRTVQQLGDEMLRMGSPTLEFSYRQLSLEGKGISSQAHGEARVEHGIRGLLAQGVSFDGYGTAWVSFGRRDIAPIGIARVEMTIPQIGGSRFIGADGFVATRWGTRIIPESRTLFPLGFAGRFGLTEARNRRAYLRPNSITTYPQPYQHWGTAKVWNLRQYVALFEDPDSALNPPKWPLWTAIANRNRVVGTLGALASAVSRPAVDNKARPLFPAGIAAPVLPEFYKAGMVAFRIRPLPLEGIEPPYFAGWSNVANGARVIKPAGRVQTIWGRPTAENTRRSYKLLGFDSAWFGYPLVADRIRTLTFEPRYTIGAPSIKLPGVRLHVRYIGAHGIDHPEVGRASLEIHWNKIWPKWTHRNFFGAPFLKNLTPELLTRGRTTDEYGDTLVRLQWRPLAAIGAETTLFGRTMIADRKQRIQVTGADYARIGNKVVVIRTGAPPLAVQWIVLDSNNLIDQPNTSYGIAVPEHQVPSPITQQQVVYVHEGEVQTRMGRPVVTANSIRVEPGIYELTVGEPMVGLRLRGMTVSGIAAPQTEVGAPRLSPHTIWAVVEAPKQAKDNHPPANLHYVNSQATIGNVRVENRHRRLSVRSAFDGMVFGNTFLDNKKQYLGVNGFQMLRMGWHTLPGDHIIEVDPMVAGDIGQPGQPVVSRPPYVGPQYLRPTGFAVNPSPGPSVEHFNRTLLALGSEMLQMGRSDYPNLPGQAPYAWRYLHVGAPMPTIPPGIASEAFGLTWVSLRVREVNPIGFDSFACEYDYQQLNKRMRVRHGTATQPAARRVYPAGAHCGFHGTPGARPGTQYIRPDGNSDQLRKGAF